mmetsp:Transcript_26884/g.59500  ORF Transcript_26884/g.59500 Transcript_26884/m.59500 type:complete len:257 (-) Transcript_26884:680-1450(-)
MRKAIAIATATAAPLAAVLAPVAAAVAAVVVPAAVGAVLIATVTARRAADRAAQAPPDARLPRLPPALPLPLPLHWLLALLLPPLPLLLSLHTPLPPLLPYPQPLLSLLTDRGVSGRVWGDRVRARALAWVWVWRVRVQVWVLGRGRSLHPTREFCTPARQRGARYGGCTPCEVCPPPSPRCPPRNCPRGRPLPRSAAAWPPEMQKFSRTRPQGPPSPALLSRYAGVRLGRPFGIALFGPCRSPAARSGTRLCRRI